MMSQRSDLCLTGPISPPIETRYTIGKAERNAPVQELLITKGVNLNPIRAAPRLL